eukprot:scaffold285882_cov30-Tisochrysis_lutea.AAC.1
MTTTLVSMRPRRHPATQSRYGKHGSANLLSDKLFVDERAPILHVHATGRHVPGAEDAARRLVRHAPSMHRAAGPASPLRFGRRHNKFLVL